MRFKALILDHDDTAVNSTAHIHHPAHIATMALLRPGQRPVDLETWFRKNFHPGIMAFLQDELGMDAAELATEHTVWQATMDRGPSPAFYPGFLDALDAYHQQGGRIAVVSHSEAAVIRRHYQEARPHLVPDLIHGWELDPDKRKPSPYPVHQILRALALAPEEVLVVDDLKPGVLMAEAAGVAVAAAGWGHDIPEIRAYMAEHCLAHFAQVEQFAEFILR
jgi:phosphoglycolate phosphatase/pyrophosphatase PpaX